MISAQRRSTSNNTTFDGIISSATSKLVLLLDSKPLMKKRKKKIEHGSLYMIWGLVHCPSSVTSTFVNLFYLLLPPVSIMG